MLLGSGHGPFIAWGIWECTCSRARVPAEQNSNDWVVTIWFAPSLSKSSTERTRARPPKKEVTALKPSSTSEPKLGPPIPKLNPKPLSLQPLRAGGDLAGGGGGPPPNSLKPGAQSPPSWPQLSRDSLGFRV